MSPLQRRLSLTFEMPHGGEYYESVVTANRVGLMFFKAREVVDVLLSRDDVDIITGLNNRPVVAFIFEDAPGREAGVQLGHFLCKVNGESVDCPRVATEKIRAAKRPMELLFYVPDWTTIHFAEAELMVKCDAGTDDKEVPFSLNDWDKKYVVVGGMLGCSTRHGHPPRLRMCFYNSKSEYDTAVLENNASKEVSVNAVDYELEDVRIECNSDGDEDQQLPVAGTDIPLTYIVVVSKGGKHIHLASFEPSQLRIIHDALRKVIKGQEPPPSPVETTGGGDGEANDAPETEKVGNGEGELAQAPEPEKASVEEVTEAFGACKVVVKHEDTEAAIKRGSFCMLDSWD